MPLLFKVRLPKKNKTILFIIFLIGAFTVRSTSSVANQTNSLQIVASALNKYYSFTHPFGTEWTIWYLRESYTAILCANLPLTYPLIQRVFKLRNWSNPSNATHTYNSTVEGPQTTHTSWSATPRTPQIPNGFHDVFRRTESQEDMNGGLGKQREDYDQPRFNSNVVEMEERNSPPISNPESHLSWQSVDEGTRPQHPYHGV